MKPKGVLVLWKFEFCAKNHLGKNRYPELKCKIYCLYPQGYTVQCHLCFVESVYYGGDFTHGFDTQNYPKLQASLGTQPENTHRFQRQTQPNPYPWIFSGNTLGYPRVPALNFYPWVPWVPVLNFYPWVPWTSVRPKPPFWFRLRYRNRNWKLAETLGRYRN